MRVVIHRSCQFDATAPTRRWSGFTARSCARASATGARLEADAIPVAVGADLDDALAGGDDYELCFAAPDPRAVEGAFAAAGLAPPVRIGVTREGSEVSIVGPDGEVRELTASGWEHPVP